THLIPEGHSTQQSFSDLENMKDDLPSFSKKVDCRLEIDRTGPTIFLHVWFKGEFNIQCARCLETFPFTIKGDFRAVLKEVAGKSGRSQDEDVADFFFNDRNDTVDLSPLLYEEILTAIPLKPLCNSECKGIVVDKSKVSFESESKERTHEIDPRWEALRKLKQN
ncbi:MAG TPA: YceD family protein, partial [Chitinispirillaceae bacterium]|nr:YceD family protein [Chitinispirillaceae bacterium]